MSYIHYWVLQITFVSTPTLVYLGHAVHVIHKEKRTMEQLKVSTHGNVVKKPKYTDDRGKVKIRGIIFCTYMTQLVFKILLEVGFTVGQFFLFGSVFMVSFFHCTKSPPCARLSGAQCYISRPTEKTIFILFMLVVSGVSVVLSVIEIIYLLCNKGKDARRRRLAQQHVLSPKQYPLNPARGGRTTQDDPPPPFPAAPSLTGVCSEEKHGDSVSKDKDS